MPILVSRSTRAASLESERSRDALRDGADAWRLLGLIGGTFAVLGFTDIALGWYPAAFGSPEWEFGTISGSLNALTIPMFGLYLLAASAVARGDGRSARILGALLATLAVALLVLGFLYVTVLPLALKAASGNPLLLLGIRKAIAKGILLGVGYLLLLIVGATRLWRVGSLVVS